MAPNKPFNIAQGVANSFYSDVEFEHNSVQPIYVLHRDSIRTFMHEKIAGLQRSGQMFGLIGIDVSLLAALAAATFNDLWLVPGFLVHAIFIVCAVICSLYIAWLLWCIGLERGTMSVDELVEELSQRGAVIRPNQCRRS